MWVAHRHRQHRPILLLLKVPCRYCLLAFCCLYIVCILSLHGIPMAIVLGADHHVPRLPRSRSTPNVSVRSILIIKRSCPNASINTFPCFRNRDFSCVSCVIAERRSGPSQGPAMSLGVWLPSQHHEGAATPHSVAHSTQSAAHQSSCPQSAQPRILSRQQPDAMPSQQQALMQQREHVSGQCSAAMQQQGEMARQPCLQGPSARDVAQRRRRQCLLEIERELLRHSSSDDEAPSDGMHLPSCPAAKRQKTACTGRSCVSVRHVMVSAIAQPDHTEDFHYAKMYRFARGARGSRAGGGGRFEHYCYDWHK